MFDEQDGKCMICKKPPRSRKLAVDHNHQTGEVRSLLCTKCNTALGLVNEDKEILFMMLEYL